MLRVHVRRLLLLFLITGMTCLNGVSAQNRLPVVRRSALVKTNLLGPFSFFAEVPVAIRQSVQLSVQRVNFGLFNTTRFFSLTADYRFYSRKYEPSARHPNLSGFYVSPYLKYRTVDDVQIGLFYGTTLSTVSYTMAGGGVVIGKQFINRSGVTLDLFLGAGYYPFITWQTTTPGSAYKAPEARPDDYQLDIRPGLSLGLAF